jgi:hypothetical protein
MGIGISLAQRAVSAVFGPPAAPPSITEVPKKDPCIQERTLMDTCFKVRGSDMNCEAEMAKYKECIKFA